MSPKRTLASEAGFTYVAMIVMVTVIMIMMSQVAVSWKTFAQREKEAELICRGMQIRDALQRYYYGRVVPVATDQLPAIDPKKPNPADLEALVKKDTNSLETRRYLRPFALIDPITGEEWEVKRENGRLVGVHSKSEAEPIKKFNFPYQLEPADFEDKKKYSEWVFRFDRIPRPKQKSDQSGLPDSDLKLQQQ